MKEHVEVFKALSDEGRLKILKFLSTYERCACDIQDQMKLTQPTISHHMKVLQQAGIINVEKRGRWMYYSIKREKLEQISSFLFEITSSNIELNNIKGCEQHG